VELASKEKQLKKVENGKDNIRAKQLRKLMLAWGFTCREKDDGYTFKHEALKTRKIVNVAIPHRSGDKVLVCYVDECLDAIDMVSSEEKKI
jgi:hypothetical protein